MANGLLPPRPHGLGTSAAALAEAARPARAVGGLYCPTAVRDDPGLAAQVQGRLAEWAPAVGVGPGAVAGLGRLAVLGHPDTDDVGRLEVAGRLLAAGRVVAGGGATPGTVSPEGLPIDVSAADPLGPDAGAASTAAALASALSTALEEVFDACDNPGAVRRPEAGTPAAEHPALRSALAGLSALPASPYQVDRVRREYQGLAAAAPAGGGPHPPWEYLALGHVNAYSPALAALDAVDGYELTPAMAARPDLRRVLRLAALAAALLRDLAHPGPAGLTAAVARADGLGVPAAARRAAVVHDDAMRAFQYHATVLAEGADPAVRRYLAGLWTWLGGHRSWNAEP